MRYVADVSTPLRRLLATAVADRRREEAAQLERVPVGVFTSFDELPFVFIETRGRRTGIWRRKFWGVHAAWGDTLYLIEADNGVRADWVRNVLAHPFVRIREGYAADAVEYHARVVTDLHEVELAAELVSRRLNDAQWLVDDDKRMVVALDA